MNDEQRRKLLEAFFRCQDEQISNSIPQGIPKDVLVAALRQAYENGTITRQQFNSRMDFLVPNWM